MGIFNPFEPFELPASLRLTKPNPDPLWEFEDIRRSHRAAHPELTEDESHLHIVQVFARARIKHPDIDGLLGSMVVLSQALIPVWNKTSLDEYVECLICAAKHADFMKEARAEGSREPCQEQIQ